ncbi:MAG: GNAT family N-acetyltransferase [Kineosporiaceae bacterium]|nr:GNAT family N-acetyltransferase [Kineosporiaceae bacterium]
MRLTTRPLDPSTWDDFVELMDRNNGVFGGCWCIGFHTPPGFPADNRAAKHERVLSGTTHSALVYDQDGVVQGWCQYGTPVELPRIKNSREYAKDLPPHPDWRIACVFVDPRHRGSGIARAAVAGALEQIAAAGGGLVEAISEVTAGRKAHGRFLFSATAELLESFGFRRIRQVGKHAWILHGMVEAG